MAARSTLRNGVTSRPHELPVIAGYRVWRGRVLLHARHLGVLADARAERRPWHVVAASSQQLVERVNGGR